MPLFVVIHEHKNGESPYIVECHRYPTEDEVEDGLSIDFEPERGEYIRIFCVSQPTVLEVED